MAPIFVVQLSWKLCFRNWSSQPLTDPLSPKAKENCSPYYQANAGVVLFLLSWCKVPPRWWGDMRKGKGHDSTLLCIISGVSYTQQEGKALVVQSLHTWKFQEAEYFFSAAFWAVWLHYLQRRFVPSWHIKPLWFIFRLYPSYRDAKVIYFSIKSYRIF